MTDIDTPLDAKISTKVPTELLADAELRALRDGYVSLSPVIRALLGMYVRQEVLLGPPPEDPRADEVRRLARRVLHDGLSLNAAAVEAGVSWPTARRWVRQYEAAGNPS